VAECAVRVGGANQIQEHGNDEFSHVRSYSNAKNAEALRNGVFWHWQPSWLLVLHSKRRMNDFELRPAGIVANLTDEGVFTAW
jgi:hypothetical protein